MPFRWWLCLLLGFFAGFGSQLILSFQPLSSPPEKQEFNVQSQPSYGELQPYARPATPEEVEKKFTNIPTEIGTLHHYRAFVGPAEAYADMSGLEFSLLYLSGLKETDSLLDIGCGALRLGRVAIPYLLPGKYHCIEPNSWLVRDALHFEVGEQILQLKQPKFAFNVNFEAPEALAFKFLIAQSIFSHTGMDMLDDAIGKIKKYMNDDSVFFNTFVKPGHGPKNCSEATGWIYPECCIMTDEAIRDVATRHDFFATPLKWRHDRQQWWAWCHSASAGKCKHLETVIPHVPSVSFEKK